LLPYIINFSDYTAPRNSATVVSVECCPTGIAAIVCLILFDTRKSHGKPQIETNWFSAESYQVLTELKSDAIDKPFQI
jgi:hypothetical protein